MSGEPGTANETGDVLVTWSRWRRSFGRATSITTLLGLKLLLLASMPLVGPGRWVLIAWGLVLLADFLTLSAMLVLTWPARTTLHDAGIRLRPNGSLRQRFIRWSNVRAYQIDPPDLVALDVQNSGEVRRRDHEVVKFEFPEARLTEIGAILAERVQPDAEARTVVRA